jgi:hypothetical protein
MKLTLGQLLRGKRFAEQADASKKRLYARVRSEVFDPVLALPRMFLVGLLGSAFIAIGVAFFLVGSLRLIEHFWAFQGNTSWLSYLVVWFEACLIGLFTVWRIVRTDGVKKDES